MSARTVARTARGLTAAAVLAAACPSAAAAATAGVFVYQTCSSAAQCKYGVYDAHLSLEFRPAPGEGNRVVVSRSGDEVRIRDAAATVSPGDRCRAVDEHEVACDAKDVQSVSVATGDRDDSVDAGALRTGLSIALGAGDDVATSGSGNDRLHGGEGSDDLRGGAGDDVFQEDGAAAADRYDGGPGEDAVSYEARTRGVSVDLASAAPGAGEPGEGDAVTAIEAAVGGSADDRLGGGEGDDRLTGGPGDDDLTGGDGDDVLDGGRGSDTVDAGAGDDRLELHNGRADADVARCGAGRDRIAERVFVAEDDIYGDTGENVWTATDAPDLVGGDCEALALSGPRTEDPFLVDPRLVRAGPSTVRVRNPCRSAAAARRCAGRLTLHVAGRDAVAGRKRFSRRARTVAVPLTRAGRRALAGDGAFSVDLRIRRPNGRIRYSAAALR